MRAVEDAGMRFGTLVLIVWLVVGAVAAGQRHYYSEPISGCSRVGTIAETIAVGPLNYVGVNPKASCRLSAPRR
jgi:hypothetical protein